MFRRGFPALPQFSPSRLFCPVTPGVGFSCLSSKPQTCSEGYPTVLHWTPVPAYICPVCAKLPAPANDAGFRTVETISVHGEGFTLHGDKHNSYSRIQLRSGTKYQVNFAMSTLRCRLQQEFTG
ncbi:uncharacterized protein LOC144920516 [Branchiostoma floridae x Branchiostoma belcheri]